MNELLIVDSGDQYEFEINLPEQPHLLGAEELPAVSIDTTKEDAPFDDIAITDNLSVASHLSEDDFLSGKPRKRLVKSVKIANPPPESFVGKCSSDLVLGLVKYKLSTSTVIVTENFIKYLKFVLTYDCLSDNRLGNTSTTGSCVLYYRNQKFSMPILYSSKPEEYYHEIFKVFVSTVFH